MAAMIVGGLRLTHGVLAIQEGPGLDLGIDVIDALEAIRNQLGGRQTAVANTGGRFGEAEGP